MADEKSTRIFQLASVCMGSLKTSISRFRYQRHGPKSSRAIDERSLPTERPWNGIQKTTCLKGRSGTSGSLCVTSLSQLDVYLGALPDDGQSSAGGLDSVRADQHLRAPGLVLVRIVDGTAARCSRFDPLGYIDLLDPEIHFTGPRRLVRRQRINDNLIGSNGYSPLVRKTNTPEDIRG